MRKILLIFTFILFSTLAYAGPNDKINESGFINKEVRLIKNFEIKDPKNKIILIYNHGQDENDIAINCTWVSMLRNHASLIDQEVNGKKIAILGFALTEAIALFALISGLALVWWFYFLFIIGCLIVLLGSYFNFLKVKKEFQSSTKEEYKLLP